MTRASTFLQRSPLLLLAVALMALAVFVVGDGAPPASAQPTAYVSNLGQTSGIVNFDLSTASDALAQQFTTGSETGGYALGSIDVKIRNAPTTAAQRDTIRAELWSAVASGGNAGEPNAKLATLTVPAHPISAGTVNFAAPANTTLAASTSYNVVIYTTGDLNLGLVRTNATDEDSGGATGWSIRDRNYNPSAGTRNTPSGITDWGTSTGATYAMQIAVNPPATDATDTPVRFPPQTDNPSESRAGIGVTPDSDNITLYFKVGQAVSVQFPAAHTGSGTSPYTYALGGPERDYQRASRRALPGGLTFNASTRTLSGTPTGVDSNGVTTLGSDRIHHYHVWDDSGAGGPDGDEDTEDNHEELRVRIHICRADSAATADGATACVKTAELYSLEVSHGDPATAVTLSPAFDRDTETYTASVAESVTAVDVSVLPEGLNADRVKMTVGGEEFDARQSGRTFSGKAALASGANVIKVEITSGTSPAHEENMQGERIPVTKTYTVTVTRGGVTASTNANLSGLTASSNTSATGTFSALTLTPAFDADTTSYSATVANSITHVKLTPTVEDSGATVTVGGFDTNSGSASQALAMDVGTNSIIVEVTAEDGVTTKAYQADITRRAATVSLSASPTTVDEGNSVTVTATLTTAQSGDVTIPVTITDNTAQSGDHGTLTGITISGGSTTGTGTITTTQDTDDESDETFTVALGSPLPTGITAGTPSSVQITIRDDDTTTATVTVSLSASPTTVDEGNSVTVTATLTTAQSGDVSIPITITDNTAQSGDHGTLTGITISGGSTTGTGTISTTQDSDDESDETFTVALGTPLPTGITAGSPSSVQITIRDDDTTPPTTTQPDGSTKYWAATLAVKDVDYGLGCGYRRGQYQCDDALTNDTFTYHGAEYTIELVHVAYNEGTLQLILDREPKDRNGSTTERSRMAFLVGDRQFLFKDALVSGGIADDLDGDGVNEWTNEAAYVLTWTGSDLTWYYGVPESLCLVTLPIGGL